MTKSKIYLGVVTAVFLLINCAVIGVWRLQSVIRLRDHKSDLVALGLLTSELSRARCEVGHWPPPGEVYDDSYYAFLTTYDTEGYRVDRYQLFSGEIVELSLEKHFGRISVRSKDEVRE